jgi:glycogen phosphorylase
MIPTDISSDHPIAYFCAEYGLDHNLPIYAGGLGVLSGDTLKAAVDAKLPVAAVGLLYRGNDARQVITEDGTQKEEDIFVDPLSLGLEHVNVDEQPLFIQVHLTQVNVWMHCWRKKLSENVTLYLLDTETEQNHEEERTISHSLYHGTEDSQFQQQLLLGIGGVKLLHALNIHPALYHLNEGRPAFLHWQLIRSYMDQHGMKFDEAKAAAKDKTVYTNHTLVGAGNPGYDANLVRTYGQYYAEKMGIDIQRLIDDGLENDNPKTFNLTRFALNVSRKASGVSQMHYELSKQQWPEYDWVGITNGVHLPTWQDTEIKAAIGDVEQLWDTHLEKKRELMKYVNGRTGYSYDPNRFVISWARRIAGYKQLEAVFADVERLRQLLSNQDRPCQILIAGKAHFGDTHGKALLKKIIGYMKQQLAGYVLFVPDYNLEVSKMLVSGSDLWLNTPQKGKEASGTSGMKAISNGVLQVSVSDGWVPEVDWNGKGWLLDDTNLSQDLYNKLEQEIIPLFYNRDEDGVPTRWVEMMQASITEAENFSAKRMLAEYRQQLYS